MRNRAKCKLCGDIIESFHPDDYVSCKCGEIYVDAGTSMYCGANLWCNFLRVDDEGNEIIVKVQEKEDKIQIEQSHKPTKEDMLKMLDEMLKTYENLPMNAMLTPITHSDFTSLLILISSILRA